MEKKSFASYRDMKDKDRAKIESLELTDKKLSEDQIKDLSFLSEGNLKELKVVTTAMNKRAEEALAALAIDSNVEVLDHNGKNISEELKKEHQAIAKHLAGKREAADKVRQERQERENVSKRASLEAREQHHRKKTEHERDGMMERASAEGLELHERHDIMAKASEGIAQLKKDRNKSIASQQVSEKNERIAIKKVQKAEAAKAARGEAQKETHVEEKPAPQGWLSWGISCAVAPLKWAASFVYDFDKNKPEAAEHKSDHEHKSGNRKFEASSSHSPSTPRNQGKGKKAGRGR